MIAKRISRVYTISLPPELAQRAEALAKRDSRTMSDLFREAFRAYWAQRARKTLEEIGDYAAGRNPHGHAQADVPGLIAEVRANGAPAKKRRRRGAKAKP